MPQKPPPNNTIESTAPSEAPADTPINPGSAKGLRNKACNAAPATANTPPAKQAKSTLGKRICINKRW